jgi:hypothetical protein
MEVMETVGTVIGISLGAYTVLSRVIPTNKTWCVIGIVLNALKGVSDALDNKKKKHD